MEGDGERLRRLLAARREAEEAMASGQLVPSGRLNRLLEEIEELRGRLAAECPRISVGSRWVPRN